MDYTIDTIRNIKDQLQDKIKLPYTPIRLRDLIRGVRAARTAAEERSVVNKECAEIRNGFRDDDTTWRCRNIAKLLYIHMLGYPTHFGQIEVMKLIAQPRFTDKRIGYLGAMLLLDERQEVHLLITNCLKNDLNNSNQYIAGLACCALAEICSVEMCRDLAPDIEKLIKSSNTFLRKKACLCAFRIIRRVPDLMELFIPIAKPLLTDKNHAVIISAVALISEMAESNLEAKKHFKKVVPNLVRTLKTLTMSGYTVDHDVSGVADPFLQVKIIRLLRILGTDDDESCEIMSDVLAQVATNTESTRNVGNAILYECVNTIMGTNSESGLRVLAINILGRFLLNNDKNVRYVALNTLLQTVNVDNMAVQRHRATVLECLKDPDHSIKKRALELSFALINSTNVEAIASEMLTFLGTANAEFRRICASKLYMACEMYAPSMQWEIDTMLKVIFISGNDVPESVVSNLIQYITECEQLQQYVTQELYKHLLDSSETEFQPLVQVAAWILGEFGDLLPQTEQFTIAPVLEKLEAVLANNHTSLISKEYAMNSLVKLAVRFPASSQQIDQILLQYRSNVTLEIQQRSVEYDEILRQPEELRLGLLERMPVVMSANRPAKTMNGESSQVTAQKSADSNLLGDMAGLVLDSSANPMADLETTTVPDKNSQSKGKQNDLLELLDSSGGGMVSGFLSAPTNPSIHSGEGLFADLGAVSTSPAPVINPSSDRAKTEGQNAPNYNIDLLDLLQ